MSEPHMGEKWARLLSCCKCGVFLTVNEHRNYYDTAEKALMEAAGRECPPEIASEVRQRMIETDTIIALQFYPDTPIGSYEVWHYDLESTLDMALACLKEPPGE